jgi:hypothetical protein
MLPPPSPSRTKYLDKAKSHLDPGAIPFQFKSTPTVPQPSSLAGRAPALIHAGVLPVRYQVYVVFMYTGMGWFHAPRKICRNVHTW